MQKLPNSLISRLAHPRWVVLIIVCALVVFAESLEHYMVGETIFSYHYLSEIFMYGLMIPIFGAILLVRLESAEAGRNAAASDLSDVHRFGEQLRNSLSWKEMYQRIAELPGTLVSDVISSCLYLYDPAKEDFQQVARTGCMVSIPSTQEYTGCLQSNCLQEFKSAAGVALLHTCSSVMDQYATGQVRYCLPLVYQEQIKGLLHFTIPEGHVLTSDQRMSFVRLGVGSAMAIENTRLQKLLDDQSIAVVHERQRIARDLHDTIGQNITYLRLKLDQLSNQHILGDIAAMQHELERMRDVANQAYESVRGRLAELQPATNPDVIPVLRSMAQEYSGRLKIPITVISQGKPILLRPEVQRQLLFICREALTNIEKHSRASAATLSLHWMDTELQVCIRDDGMGFAPSKLNGAGHYGIGIMAERAELIQARVAIESAVGQGASLTVYLPLARQGIDGNKIRQGLIQGIG